MLQSDVNSEQTAYLKIDCERCAGWLTVCVAAAATAQVVTQSCSGCEHVWRSLVVSDAGSFFLYPAILLAGTQCWISHCPPTTCSRASSNHQRRPKGSARRPAGSSTSTCQGRIAGAASWHAQLRSLIHDQRFAAPELAKRRFCACFYFRLPCAVLI